MEKLNKYKDFLYEFNRKDIAILKSSDMKDYFTIAYEFELETEDEEGLQEQVDFDEEILDDVKKDTVKELGLRGPKFKKARDFIANIILSIEEELEEDASNFVEVMNNYCNPNGYPDGEYSGVRIHDIVYYVRNLFIAYYKREDINYLIGKVEENLPNFYKKWNDKLDFVLDCSLDRGIEFKHKLYHVGLDEAVEVINDFFEEFPKQNYWKFSDNTGLHVNIGVSKKVKWNALKGLVMLSDMSEKDVPFTFKDMTWRMNSKFTQSLRKQVIDLMKVKSTKKKFHLDMHQLHELEDEMYKFLPQTIIDLGDKYYGFNLAQLMRHNYVEFRYVGGVINKDLLIDKTMYFCYIVYLMTSDYKEQDYHKKVYKYIEELNEVS